jgi:hypothetical protein
VMKKKFTKYWKKSYLSLCVRVIFYPRYKLKFIEFLFTDSFPTTAKSKLNRLESLVKQLFIWMRIPFQDLKNLIYCTGGGAIVLCTQSYLS